MASLYHGNQLIKETGDGSSYGIYKGDQPIRAIYKGSDRVYLFKRSQTWQAGTTLAAFTVSNDVTKLQVDCVGSQGTTFRGAGGKGGRVQCVLTVSPNQTIYVTVGGVGASQNTAVYNAADIRTNNSGITDTASLNSRLVVAGGGGSGTYGNVTGGAGGGLTGGNGGNQQGHAGTAKGGTQTDGGAAASAEAFATNGSKGKFGLGGNGGGGAGAGGAGWYGGGGGSKHDYAAVTYSGGGGGSSYTNANLCSNVTHTQGYQTGAGYITITEIA